MKERYTLIKHARLVRVKERFIEDCDILVHHGGGDKRNVIAAVEKSIDRKTLSDATVTLVNARGNLVMPSFTDLSVCLREPGAMYKEDILSTCRAAMAGGYSALLSYFEPDARFSTEDVLTYFSVARKHPAVTIYPSVFAGEADWDVLFALGAKSVSDRFTPFENAGALRAAMQKAKDKKMPYFAFLQIPSLIEGGTVNAGIAPMMKQKPISPVSEVMAVSRALLLAEEVGCALHLSGVSLAKSFSLIREAKKAGLPVTCDVSPYHFFFDESAILYYGNTAKMMPPLRSDSDRVATLEAIADGTVDAIASHHVPNDKRDTQRTLAAAPFGAVSLETVFSACVDKLLLDGVVDIFRLAELLSVNPHRILLSSCGYSVDKLCEFAVGDPADFNLVSIDTSMPVTEDRLKGRAKNTPFIGMTLRGRVEHSFFAKENAGESEKF